MCLLRGQDPLGSGLVPILREKRGKLQLVLKVVPSHTFRCSDKYQPTSGFGIGLWPFLPLLDLQSSFRSTESACDLFSIFPRLLQSSLLSEHFFSRAIRSRKGFDSQRAFVRVKPAEHCPCNQSLIDLCS